MSIWGPGPFDNDDAADWFDDFTDRPDLAVIREALEEVADPTHVGLIDIADGGEAIAAAAVLADVLGTANSELDLTDEQTAMLKAEWEAESLSARQSLIRHALSSVELVLNDDENSELRQIWESDGEGLAQWIEEMNDLQSRLVTIAGNTR
jgi:hypothetical protein